MKSQQQSAMSHQVMWNEAASKSGTRRAGLKKRYRRIIGVVLTYMALLLVLIFVLFPIYWIVTMSLKNQGDTFVKPPVWIFWPILDNYREVLSNQDFLRRFVNSLVVSASASALATVLGIFAAYSIARFEFKGRKGLAFWILSTRMFPPIAAVLPFFMLARQVRLFDTYLILILAYLTFTIPFSVWMIKGFIEGIPQDLEESAMVDGCSRLGAVGRIIIPLAAPGIAATMIINLIFCWNEFLFALMLTGENVSTLSVGASLFVEAKGINWTRLAAASVIIASPMVVFGVLVQRYIIQGMTFGAVKG